MKEVQTEVAKLRAKVKTNRIEAQIQKKTSMFLLSKNMRPKGETSIENVSTSSR